MKIAILILLVSAVTVNGFDWQKKLRKFASQIKSAGVMEKANKYIKHVFGHKEERTDGKPWFCHDLDCPPFDVIETTDKYEERCYNETVWVATGMTAPHTATTSFKGMFKKLFNYISGENDRKEKVKMTAPVLVSMKLVSEDTLDFQMHFFVPNKIADSIPEPTNPDVKIVKLPRMCVYVHHFGGWMMSAGKSMKKRMTELQNALEKDGKSFDETELFYAGYDSPFRLLNRHNEVMFMKKEKVDEPQVNIVS